MPLGAMIALLLSLLSAWLASAAADWRYVPWGANNAEIYFGLSLLVLLVSATLVSGSLRRIGLNRTGWIIAAVAAGLLAFALGEHAAWTSLHSEYPILARQVYGLAAAPLPIAGALLALRSKTAPAEPSSFLRSAALAVMAAVVGISFAGVLLYLRGAALGDAYGAFQTTIFAVLVTSAVCAVGALASRLRNS